MVAGHYFWWFLCLFQHRLCQSVVVLDDWVLPSVVNKGDKVDLRCNYNMRGEELYSLKWYRDNVEFYRYIPSEVPSLTVFVMPGLEVLDYSSPTHIVLNNVVADTSGHFKCEVSAGPPRFTTAARTTQLQIVDLPTSGPQIYGLNPSYRLGETLNLTCESGPSSPPTKLRWFINSSPLPADSHMISRKEPVFPLLDKRAISRSILLLPLTEDVVPLEVECRSTVREFYRESVRKEVRVRGARGRHHRRRSSTPHPPPSIFASSASSLSPSTLVLLIMISAVLLVQSPTCSVTTKILSMFAFSPTVKRHLITLKANLNLDRKTFFEASSTSTINWKNHLLAMVLAGEESQRSCLTTQEILLKRQHPLTPQTTPAGFSLLVMT